LYDRDAGSYGAEGQLGGITSAWVPGTTPFRYPGGKAFLYADIRRRLSERQPASPVNYAEPYAGGAGTAILLLANNDVERVFLNDYDWRVYAAWQAMLQEPIRFVEKIMSIGLDVETWKQQREIVYAADRVRDRLFEVGFATFFLNRTNRSGIISGAGPIGGYDQTGRWKIDARFPREALAARVQWISDHRDQIELSNNDGLAFLRSMAKTQGSQTFFFIDPPYVREGSRLYMNAMSEMLHLNLAKFLIGNRDMSHWVLTYDDHPLIRSAYAGAVIDELDVRYSLQKKRSANELLIVPSD
jgi:DNA adenine methylase